MAATDDGQAAAIPNGIADAKAVGAGGVTAVPVPPATVAVTETFVSGTAKLLTNGAAIAHYLYINITTAATFKLEMGPTSAAAVTVNASQSDALGLVSVRVPAGWYVKVTGTVADFVCLSLPATA